MPAIPLLFTKSHVKQYTRRDGTVVKEHDDKRQAARPQMPGPGRQPGQEQASAQRVQESAPAYGAQAGYGTHNVEPGDKLHFEAGAFKGQGQVKAVGEHGAQVDDETGRTHNVHWHEVRGFQANRTPEQQQANEPKQPNTVLGKQDPIPAASFKASDYAQSHDQADVSEESVLANFPPDTKEKIAKANARLVNIEQTLDQFKKDGVWTAERKKLHDSIRDKILSPEIVKNAMPPEGTPPTFILLGGRGGSGKSSFVGQVYDPKTSIVLDADHIKSLLPEYEGWNAAQVHEESGEIFDSLVKECRELGVNVVLDKTMKTAKSALKDVADFKGAGYRTEAHYMHLPRQEAAKRAVGRFLNGGPNGRYVPIKVVLENTTNESAFDQVREQVDAWSFRDNNVPKGSGPILISQSDNPPGFKPSNPSAQPAKTEAIMKAVGNAKMLLWRIR